MDQQKNYYKILQVDSKAEQSVIKSAWKSLSQIYHPDKQSGSGEMMALINEAYEVLSDPKRRQLYDENYHHKLDEIVHFWPNPSLLINWINWDDCISIGRYHLQKYSGLLLDQPSFSDDNKPFRVILENQSYPGAQLIATSDNMEALERWFNGTIVQPLSNVTVLKDPLSVFDGLSWENLISKGRYRLQEYSGLFDEPFFADDNNCFRVILVDQIPPGGQSIATSNNKGDLKNWFQYFVTDN